MRLEEFRTVLMERVRAFDKYVRADMLENPNDWYTVDDADQWEEQWEAFCS